MRETVALAGPIDRVGRKVIKDGLSRDFSIREIYTQEEFEQLEDVQYVILRTLQMDAATIRSLPNLKFIQRWGVGYDSVDIHAAGERGIQVAITSGINSIPVAEYTVLLMLSVYRNLIQTHRNVVSGLWRDNDLIDRSYLISGKKVGLLGFGNIGKMVAERVQAFGASVCYHDLIRLPPEEERKLDICYLPFDELVATSDILSLHLPLTSKTKNLIDRNVLLSMKSTAILVNTSRGGIINEEDLYEVLSQGRILGAGLDVFEHEPVPKDHPLLTLDNVVLSAHSAGNTIDNSVMMGERCVENIIKVSRNIPLDQNDLVNTQYLKI